MRERSIEAYDRPERVAAYDASMDLMHPNRVKMIEVALEVMSFPEGASLLGIDLGCGTGYFTQQFLRRYPRGRVVAIDGAEAMLDLARARLGALSDRVEFRAGDFRDVARLAAGHGPADAVFSSFALHHLDRPTKHSVIRDATALLRPGGWFLNADIIVSGAPGLERRIQEIRVDGIVARARGLDDRFPDAATTRAHLDEMQSREEDQPLTMEEDLAILRTSGLEETGVFWLEYREAVTGGCK